jgi:hypothetical protein
VTEAEASAVYDVLVRECGANEWSRTDFVYEFVSPGCDCTEWRFQGELGFGGKFYPREMRVSCYPEDETPKRRTMVERANAALRKMVKS